MTRPRRHQRRRGGSAAELVLAGSFLLIVLLICIDFCRVLYAYTTITNVARNGALWASDPLASTQSPYATVQAAAQADANANNNLSPALTSANITQTAGTDGHGNATAIVTVQYQMNLLTSYLGMGTITMSRQVTMRVAPRAPN